MALALASDDKRQYAPAWRWIAENYLVRDGDTGKPVPFIVFPWIARILQDVLPENLDHLPYSLAVLSTLKKSGKTSLNGAIAAYLLFERGPANPWRPPTVRLWPGSSPRPLRVGAPPGRGRVRPEGW